MSENPSAAPSIILNNILCYISSMRKTKKQDDIILSGCLGYYSEDEIKAAKKALCELTGVEPIWRRCSDKLKAELVDILEIFKMSDAGSEPLPIFVTNNHEAFPPNYGFDILKGTIAQLVDHISKLEEKMDTFENLNNRLEASENNSIIMKEEMIEMRAYMQNLQPVAPIIITEQNTESDDGSISPLKVSKGTKKIAKDQVKVVKDLTNISKSPTKVRKNTLTELENNKNKDAVNYKEALTKEIDYNNKLIDQYKENTKIMSKEEIAKRNKQTIWRVEGQNITPEETLEFSEPKNNRNKNKWKNPGIFGTKKSEPNTFGCVPRLTDIYVGRVILKTTRQEILDYIEKEFKIKVYECKEIDSYFKDTRRSKSYCVTVDSSNHEDMLIPERWPENTKVKKFIRKRYETENQNYSKF